jgi:hypothetical protein
VGNLTMWNGYNLLHVIPNWNKVHKTFMCNIPTFLFPLPLLQQVLIFTWFYLNYNQTIQIVIQYSVSFTD